MENISVILATVLVMLGAFWLYERDQSQKRQIEALKKENVKLMDANRKNLPYNTAEELENLLATVIVLEKDIEIKSNLVGNIRAHAELARENRRAGAAFKA